MIRHFTILTILILSHIYSISQSGFWKAGVFKLNITPPAGMWMAGYAHRDHPAEGKLHDLWAKALVLEDQQGKKAVFVATDLLGLPRNISEKVSKRIMNELGLSRSQIMLTSSHTHTGPVLRDALWDMYDLDDSQTRMIEKYSVEIEDKMVEVVLRAANKMKPASVFTGSGVCRFAVNRRNNAEAEILQVSELNGPIDHSVPVIKVVGKNGKVKAIVFGYACHATTLSSYKWSGDFAGFTQIELEKRYPKALALFFAGCAGDQNPLPRRSVPLAEQYGRTLAAAVSRVLEEQMEEQAPVFSASYEEISLPLIDPPDNEALRAMIKAEETTTYSRNWARRWLAFKQKNNHVHVPRNYPHYPIQIWKIGNQPIVSLGGEVVVGYAIRLKNELNPSLFVVAYANDVMAYIPTVRILEEGGYEGYLSMHVYGLASTWSPKVEDMIIQEVARQLNKLNIAK